MIRKNLPYINICDSLPLGIFVVDKNRDIRYWNTWLAQKTSITEEDAAGRKLSELFPDFKNRRFMPAVDLVINTKSPQVLSQALNHFLVPIVIEESGRHGLPLMQQQVRINPLVADDGEVYAVISIQDVTESVIRSSILTELTHKLQEESTRDPLTGIFNRRFMWEWLAPHLKISLRDKKPLACLMIDIDHFKLLNDTYGHHLGDEVLRGLVDLAQHTLRESDILVRYGGEEFVALLPGNDLNDGVMTAQRVVDAIKDASLASLKKGHVTCSIGVSEWDPKNPCTIEELLKFADKNLYKAKNFGRNRVCPELDKIDN